MMIIYLKQLIPIFDRNLRKNGNSSKDATVQSGIMAKHILQNMKLFEAPIHSFMSVAHSLLHFLPLGQICDTTGTFHVLRGAPKVSVISFDSLILVKHLHKEILKYHVVIPNSRRIRAIDPTDVTFENRQSHLVSKTAGLEFVTPKSPYVVIMDKGNPKISAIDGK